MNLTDYFLEVYNCNVYTVTDINSKYIQRVYFCSKGCDLTFALRIHLHGKYYVPFITKNQDTVDNSKDEAIRNAIKQKMEYEN